MKQFLLFAGTESAKTAGVHGLVGDFDSIADAFLSLVDHQTPSEWWHVLDTKTGEVYERRHIRTNNGMVAFQRSEWVVGTSSKKPAIALPTTKGADLSELEAGLRTVVTTGLKNGNGHANGHSNGAAEPTK
jgi:hypothetical protein